MKNKKKKYKVKKKSIFLILGIILLLICCIIFYFLFQEKKIKTIQNHYSTTVITTKKTYLYDKNHKKIGTIEKGITFPLRELKEVTLKNAYYPIEDSSYYLFYQDVKKTKKEKTEEVLKYIPSLKTIFTKKEVTLYQKEKKKITLKQGITSNVEFEEDDTYTIFLFGEFYQIPKEDHIKYREDSKTESSISILHFEKIEDTCGEDFCTTVGDFIEEINLLKENGYFTLSLKDFQNYWKEYIDWKPQAILITTSSEHEKINTLQQELGISIVFIKDLEGYTFFDQNQKAVRSESPISRYVIKSYTTKENLLKMANQEEVNESKPVQVSYASREQGIPVLNYHFFYDSSLGEECYESICLEVSKFKEHLDYLKQNGYKTLTMEEFRRWMYGEIELPTKSVLITVDDGAMGTGKHNGNKLIPLLEEYDMHATLFLIAGWWDIANYISPHLDIQSHTFDMHQYGSCGRGQLNCATYEEAKRDLERSLEIIGNKNSFCFPFYYYSDTSIQAVKDAGFLLAFVGGNRKATRSSNKYLIPRYPIHSDITINQFINILK